MSTEGCIFCDIVSGKAPCHKVWEDEKHIAFLSIFPNTEGVTVVVPKQHYASYIFDQSEEVMHDIMNAAKQTAQLLDATFADVARTGVVFEGFGVDHLHAKLFPLHDTASDVWKEHVSQVDIYFDRYEGYISSHNYQRADDEKLAALAKKITEIK